MTVQAFQVGKTYAMRSVCDHNARWNFKVASRTAKSVTVVPMNEVGAKPKTLRIKVWSDVETVKPFGSYSMAPQLSADRLA